MYASIIKDSSKLCIHTITTKPWPVETAIEKYSHSGVSGITVWRQAMDDRSIADVGKRISAAGLTTVSLCRGGFFPSKSELGKKSNIDDNIKTIEEAAELGAPLIVLVPGAVPGLPLNEAREQIRDGIEAVLPKAEEYNIKLAIEPLHPMYADDRSAINTMKQANNMCRLINSPFVGVAVDVYHVWWDPDLEKEINRCGKAGKLFAFHICDWNTPTKDILLDRGLMGDGCIPVNRIRKWVEDAGFDGFNEVEIFSTKYWEKDQDEFLKKIQSAYMEFS